MGPACLFLTGYPLPTSSYAVVVIHRLRHHDGTEGTAPALPLPYKLLRHAHFAGALTLGGNTCRQHRLLLPAAIPPPPPPHTHRPPIGLDSPPLPVFGHAPSRHVAAPHAWPPLPHPLWAGREDQRRRAQTLPRLLTSRRLLYTRRSRTTTTTCLPCACAAAAPRTTPRCARLTSAHTPRTTRSTHRACLLPGQTGWRAPPLSAAPPMPDGGRDSLETFLLHAPRLPCHGAWASQAHSLRTDLALLHATDSGTGIPTHRTHNAYRPTTPRTYPHLPTGIPYRLRAARKELPPDMPPGYILGYGSSTTDAWHLLPSPTYLPLTYAITYHVDSDAMQDLVASQQPFRFKTLLLSPLRGKQNWFTGLTYHTHSTYARAAFPLACRWHGGGPPNAYHSSHAHASRRTPRTLPYTTARPPRLLCALREAKPSPMDMAGWALRHLPRSTLAA